MPPAPPRTRGSGHGTLFLVAILPFLVLAFWRLSWGPERTMGDYAQYLLHARALLEGRSYGDIGYLVHPEAPDIGPQAYPPGLPLVLLPIVAVSGLQPVVLRLFMVATAAVFGWLAWRRLERDLPVPAVAVGVAFALLSIEIQRGTLAPVSDLLFGVVLWSLFLVADTDERWSVQRTLLVTALGFALVSVRLAGAAIGPALLLFAIVHRRTHGLRPYAALATWGAAALAALLLVGNPYGDTVVDRDIMNIGRKVGFLLAAYRHALSDAELYPFGQKVLDQGYHVLMTAVIAVGSVAVMRRLRWSLVSCFLAAYLGLLIVVRLAATRFLWPLLPLVGAAMVIGLTTIGERWRAWRPRAHVTAPSRWRLPLALPTVFLLMAFARELGVPRPLQIVGTPDSDALYAWLRTEAARAPARAMFHNPRVLTLYSGVPAMGVLDRTTPGQMVAIDAEQLTHVVWQRGDVSDCLQRILNAVPLRYPARFELAYENPTFRVYRVRPAATPFVAAYEKIDWLHPPKDCDAT